MSASGSSVVAPDEATTSPEMHRHRKGRGRPRRAATAITGLLAAVTLGAAVWFGFGWGKALFVDRPVADARDAALSGAFQAAINLNSVDAENVDASIENMRSSITGEALENDLAATEQQIRDQVAQTGTSMAGEVLFGTLTELNTDDEVAKALVVLAVRTTTPENFVTNKVSVNVSLREVDGVWRAETIEPLGSVQMEAGPAPGAVPPEAAPAAPAPAEAPAPEEPQGP
ncbi:Mce-associated membrane protein [Rhodococcus coprophilus]|uniref:Mce associated protein mas4a n=2 Tax=Rhodococcus coprophilus TaxID=38310 RepID=A0A2X4UFL7_9NOCA|nr:Mce-associated membrane protein [Rhodococcus coprophilus]SQI37481.1 mce associated protein mas4a [Rhodococcus coprophilus]